MIAEGAVKKAIENRKSDEEKDKAAVEHFEAQADLYTQCPQCRKHITGTLQQVLAHECAFEDLIGEI